MSEIRFSVSEDTADEHSRSCASTCQTDDSCNNCRPKRKRQRLDHLTQEEKLQRRKLKNRVAAQSARDRKKQRMSELEHSLEMLNEEKSVLIKSNRDLYLRNERLKKENEELRKRLKNDSTSVESATQSGVELFDDSDLCSFLSSSLDNDVSDKELLEMFVKCSKDILTDETTGLFDSAQLDEKSKSALSPVVGTGAERVESINDSVGGNDVNDCCLVFPIKEEVLDVDSSNDIRIPFHSEEVIVPHSSDEQLNAFLEMPKLLSPLSACQSDSGYESVTSPSSSLSSADELIVSANHPLTEERTAFALEDVNDLETVTELFPDLI